MQKPFDMHDLTFAVSRAHERRTLRSTTTLHTACHTIFATRDPSQLPRVIVDVTARAMLADDVSLLLADPAGGLHMAHSLTLSPHVQARTKLAIGERVAGRVAALRTPVIIGGELYTDPRFADVTTLGWARSRIVYPLTAGDGLLGVLNMTRIADPRPFDRPDLERAAVLASQIALALENRAMIRRIVGAERMATIGQVAAGVLHEINNPVSWIAGKIATLRRELTALRRTVDTSVDDSRWERILEMLDDAEEGAQQIRALAADMRTLSHRDQHQAVLDLNVVVRSALRIAGAEVRRRATLLEHLGAGVLVTGNASRLSQVIVNLAVNAAHALEARDPRTSHVTITTERRGDRVVAVVADDGPGIAAEHLHRVFDTCFTTKGPERGTGLGLAISRDIVRAHGGELRVDSLAGQGATFTIDLPAPSATPPQEPR